MKILGTDEAGRGPVVGPMVIAGVVIEEKDSIALKKIGVRDSKLLSPAKREIMYGQIYDVASDVIVREVTAKQIDKMRKRMSLNEVEAMVMADILEASKAKKAFIDLPDPTAAGFSKRIRKYVNTAGIELVMEHKADTKYPVVSAASIIAKTVRDKRVREIEEKYGVEIGTGYPHDERTIAFLEKFASDYPPEVRTSWSTARRHEAKKQKRLEEF